MVGLSKKADIRVLCQPAVQSHFHREPHPVCQGRQGSKPFRLVEKAGVGFFPALKFGCRSTFIKEGASFVVSA